MARSRRCKIREGKLIYQLPEFRANPHHVIAQPAASGAVPQVSGDRIRLPRGEESIEVIGNQGAPRVGNSSG